MFFDFKIKFRPFIDNALNIDILIIKINHSHSGDGGWRGIYKRVSLENEAGISSKANPLPSGQCKNMIIIKYTIKRLNPLRINITIENNPVTTIAFNNITSC